MRLTVLDIILRREPARAASPATCSSAKKYGLKVDPMLVSDIPSVCSAVRPKCHRDTRSIFDELRRAGPQETTSHARPASRARASCSLPAEHRGDCRTSRKVVAARRVAILPPILSYDSCRDGNSVDGVFVSRARPSRRSGFAWQRAQEQRRPQRQLRHAGEIVRACTDRADLRPDRPGETSAAQQLHRAARTYSRLSSAAGMNWR